MYTTAVVCNHTVWQRRVKNVPLVASWPLKQYDQTLARFPLSVLTDGITEGPQEIVKLNLSAAMVTLPRPQKQCLLEKRYEGCI